MRALTLLAACLLTASCAAPTVSAPKETKESNARAAQIAADSAFQELESGKAPAGAPAIPSRGGNYNEAAVSANEAQKELECAVSGGCPVNSKPLPADTLDEKPKPGGTVSKEIAEKPRPGGVVAESAIPGKGGKYPIVNGVPVWFSSPVYDGYIGGAGGGKAR